MDHELYCPSCRREIPDAPMVCPHCGTDLSEVMLQVECPQCGEVNSTIRSHCIKCGAALEGIKRAEYHLEHDPQIIALNDKYAKCNLIQIFSVLGIVASGMALKLYDQHNWPDLFCAVGMLGIPAFGITAFVCAVRSKMLDKKIRRALAQKE